MKPYRLACLNIPSGCLPLRRGRVLAITFCLLALYGPVSMAAQDSQSNDNDKDNGQINVNWLYGSVVPKDVPLEPLDRRLRLKLYIRQTYTTWGIYMKTTVFAARDQIHNTYPEWGGGFDGFAKRLGTRQAEFVVQNSVIALGNGVLGWEPRYDRCRCNGFWHRTRHAVVRNFVTYGGTEQSLRPQIMPFAGAAAGSALGTTWVPGQTRWDVKAYQAVITQVPVGIGVNFIGEFAPEIFGIFRRNK